LGIAEAGFFAGRMPFCHPTNNAKALKL